MFVQPCLLGAFVLDQVAKARFLLVLPLPWLEQWASAPRAALVHSAHSLELKKRGLPEGWAV